MKVLIIGSGGREHALAWKIAQSSDVSSIYVAPGNAGTATEEKCSNVSIAADDVASLLNFANAENIDLTIVGPEQPLVLGIVDAFNEANLKCFGPSKAAAQLEGSKAFSKDFLARHMIPTAAYAVFTDADEACAYISDQGAPIVVKADGLAAGKGVIVANTIEQAHTAARDMLLDNRFGNAGSRVVIEEFMTGEEASFICMVDGKNILPLATSQDHKARDNDDHGPNTGGMGAYSPAPVVTDKIHQRIMRQVIEPTVAGMSKDGNTYIGFLYAGLMIDAQGNPKVVEFNCRFGDPETQPIMMRLQSDLTQLCLKTIAGELDTVRAQWDERPALGVVLAAKGYPNDYSKDDKISGLDNCDSSICKTFHAGTQYDGENITTSGGRVLCVTALGESVTQAQANAYEAVDQIFWRGMYFRTDIGYRAIARELKE